MCYSSSLFQKYFQMCALKARQERADRTPVPGGADACSSSGPPLTLRLNSTSRSEPPPPTPPPPPPPPPDGMVTLHSIGVQLPYELTMAPPASATPPLAYHAQASLDSTSSCAAPAVETTSRPLSRDSGVPSAPLSAEVTDPDRDPFAEALQSRLAAGDASDAQRQTHTLEVPTGSQESGVGSV